MVRNSLLFKKILSVVMELIEVLEVLLKVELAGVLEILQRMELIEMKELTTVEYHSLLTGSVAFYMGSGSQGFKATSSKLLLRRCLAIVAGPLLHSSLAVH
jgi:hypothetical protein